MYSEEKMTSRREIYDGKVVKLYVDDVELDNGHKTKRELIRHPGGVCVLPLDEEGNVYMVKQFRYPFQKELLEAPAGKLEYGEDPYECAVRELSEETGFTAGGYAVHKLICGGCGRVFYTTIYTKKYCHSYWCGNQANNLRQREYRQMRRQDLVCQCCGEKFTPKRADARYCSNSCRQKVYRKRVTDAASTQNEHIVFRTVSRSVENQVPPPGT